MKKYLLLFLMAGSATFAQHKPKFGVNLGETYSNVRTNDFNFGYDSVFYGKHKYDSNFLVGVSVEIPLNERFSFVGNINYERKTFKYDALIRFSEFDDFDPIGDPKEMSIEYKTRLEYLTIPLNLKYYIDTNKRFYVNGGPFLGLFLNSKYKTDGVDEGNGNDNYKTIDFGANLGVGTNFKINDKNSLNLEIRHNYGLIDINNVRNSEHFVSSVSYMKTNSFNLIANYQFDL